MYIQDKPKAHRSRTICALMALHVPEGLQEYMTDAHIRRVHSRQDHYLPALAQGSREAVMVEHIRNGREAEAIELLEKGWVNVQARDEVGRTLLHHAGGAGMPALTERLVVHGADVDAMTIEDESVLAYTILLNAAAEDDFTRRRPNTAPRKVLEVVDRLLRHHADTELPDPEGNTPALHVAAIGDLEVMRLLRQAGASLTATNRNYADVTFKSSQAGHHELLEEYLRWGIDPRSAIPGQMSALDVAQVLTRTEGGNQKRYERCADILARGEVIAQARELSQLPVIGQDLSRPTEGIMNGLRFVHEQAVAYSDPPRAHATLAMVGEMMGFKPLVQQSPDDWLCAIAAHAGSHGPQYAEMEKTKLKEVLQRGGDAATRNQFGQTGIILQAITRQHVLMKPLAKAGGDVNAQDALLNTALHYAAVMQSREGVRTLLVLGASPLLRNWRGLTPRQAMINEHQTPLSDEYDPEAVATQASEPQDIAPQDSASSAFAARSSIPRVRGYDVDPVIQAMLEMAESRWLGAETRYRRATSLMLQ